MSGLWIHITLHTLMLYIFPSVVCTHCIFMLLVRLPAAEHEKFITVICATCNEGEK